MNPISYFLASLKTKSRALSTSSSWIERDFWKALHWPPLKTQVQHTTKSTETACWNTSLTFSFVDWFTTKYHQPVSVELVHIKRLIINHRLVPSLLHHCPWLTSKITHLINAQSLTQMKMEVGLGCARYSFIFKRVQTRRAERRVAKTEQWWKK